MIVNSDLGPLSHDAVAVLRRALPLAGPSNGTVVLNTRGLDLALSDVDAFAAGDDQAPWRDPHRKRLIEGADGVLVIAAPPPVLRGWGVELSQLGRWSPEGERSTELDYPKNGGEVQILDDFADRVETAMATGSSFSRPRTSSLSEDDRRQVTSPGDGK